MAFTSGMALNPTQLELVKTLEVEMMSDMYNRLTEVCYNKCIAPKYSNSDIGKGEGVCIDRCVVKYLDLYERIGKKLTTISTQDEEIIKKLQEQNQMQLSSTQ